MHEILKQLLLWPGFVYLLVLIASLMALVQLIAEFYARRGKQTAPETLEDQLATTLRALVDNSQQATQLLTRLQNEVSNRSKAVEEIETKLEELRKQRSLLELTDDQKTAIALLVRRQPSLKEVLTSLDFWVGRILPSTIFFILGVIVTLWLRG